MSNLHIIIIIYSIYSYSYSYSYSYIPRQLFLRTFPKCFNDYPDILVLQEVHEKPAVSPSSPTIRHPIHHPP